MATSLVYRNTLLYEAAMLALYGRHYFCRYESIADLIPVGASVVDVCCGPAILYDRYLRAKQVRYTGIDISAPFVERLKKRGGDGRVLDVTSAPSLPPADYVIMHASLCHFLPDARGVVDRMLQAARRQVIVAEPVRNLTSSSWRLVAAMARRLTDPGNGQSARRFNEESLAEFFRKYEMHVVRSFHIPGGREKVYILNAAGWANAAVGTGPNPLMQSFSTTDAADQTL